MNVFRPVPSSKKNGVHPVVDAVSYFLDRFSVCQSLTATPVYVVLIVQ